MDSITEEKQRLMLARPMKNKLNQDIKDTNIFAVLRSSEPLPALHHKIRGKSYDVVGSNQFKQKFFQPIEKQTKAQPNQQLNQMNNVTNSFMNKTINRNTILSKMSRDQTNLFTKQMRQIHRYQDYQKYWQNESIKLNKKTLRAKGAKTLLEDNVKGVYVHQNQDRMDIINNYVVHMWEMSLRNNNKILQRHIKGHKYNQVQLEQMLQTDKGLKKVEKSIPVLPIQKLKQVKKRQLSLTGRNKALSETGRSGGLSTQRLTLNQTPNQEQVYKISYTGNVKWMSTQGL